MEEEERKRRLAEMEAKAREEEELAKEMKLKEEMQARRAKKAEERRRRHETKENREEREAKEAFDAAAAARDEELIYADLTLRLNQREEYWRCFEQWVIKTRKARQVVYAKKLRLSSGPDAGVKMGEDLETAEGHEEFKKECLVIYTMEHSDYLRVRRAGTSSDEFRGDGLAATPRPRDAKIPRRRKSIRGDESAPDAAGRATSERRDAPAGTSAAASSTRASRRCRCPRGDRTDSKFARLSLAGRRRRRAPPAAARERKTRRLIRPPIDEFDEDYEPTSIAKFRMMFAGRRQMKRVLQQAKELMLETFRQDEHDRVTDENAADEEAMEAGFRETRNEEVGRFGNLRTKWERLWDAESGQPYWYQWQTQESLWEKPVVCHVCDAPIPDDDADRRAGTEPRAVFLARGVGRACS